MSQEFREVAQRVGGGWGVQCAPGLINSEANDTASLTEATSHHTRYE
jgi:hypothetical protein